MSDTIYWGVKLDTFGVASLLNYFPPMYPNVYAEHMTIVFKPSEAEDKLMMAEIGMPVDLQIIGYAADDNAEAAVVTGHARLNPGVPHITISTANGVGPVHSNKLLAKGWHRVDGPTITGVVGRFTKRGWLLLPETE